MTDHSADLVLRSDPRPGVVQLTLSRPEQAQCADPAAGRRACTHACAKLAADLPAGWWSSPALAAASAPALT